MFDFDPYKSRMILTTPSVDHEYWFRVRELKVEQSYCEAPKIEADLELERMEPKGTKLFFAKSLPTVTLALKNLKARRIVFNPPATVVLWEDGTKTVVKCDKEDEYNVITGVALCYMKKALGNTSRELNKALNNAKKFIDKEEE